MKMAENETADKKVKDDHDQLAAVIKGVHKHLRREYRANNQQSDATWHQHSQNERQLQLYADAMYRLATEHWSVFPETRIEWCHKVAVEYFLHDGMRVAIEKDAKRKFHDVLRLKQKKDNVSLCETVSSNQTTAATTEDDPVNVSDGSCQHGTNDLTQRKGTQETPDFEKPVVPQFTGKIRLFDVGSCYNPFLEFQEFEAVGIDLCPAKESVLRCDFLGLKTTTLTPEVDPLTFDLQSLTSPVEHLPCCSFHVVVFSLLLEYLPSPAQRWKCCVKACDLLTTNGLLLIITPDSHSQHRNAPMMKSWKEALELLGFRRWKYEKKDHIHCLAFRKIAKEFVTLEMNERKNLQGQRPEDMLYIPQDLNDACYEDPLWEGNEATVQVDNPDTESFVLEVSNELPLFDDS